jgi:RND superfamily putative drug exporter
MRTLRRFALRRPRLVIALWLVLLAGAAPFALRLAGLLRGSTDMVPGSASELVSRDIDRTFGEGSAFVFPAVLTSADARSDDPRFAAAVVALEHALGAAGMKSVRHAWNTGDSAMVGRDGRSALLLVTPPARSFFDAESMVDSIRHVVRGAGLASGFEVKVTGMVSLFHDLDTSASEDLLRAERIGIPLTMVVLLAVFGAPLAAALPLLIALGATVLTLAVLFALSHTMPVSVFAQNAVTMIGLGVGVDYALFLVSRCRDELKAGKSFRDAVEIATLRTVHVVVVSGLAVCTGFVALLLVRVPFLHTLAFGGVAVVVTAVLTTLMVLPALLIVVGERVNWPRRIMPASNQRAHSTRSHHPTNQLTAALAHGMWGRWAQQTMVKPWRYLVPAVVVLAVLIVPTMRLRAWNVGAHDLPAATEARQGYDLLARNFAAGWMAPIAILVESSSGSLATPSRQRALLAEYERLAADPRVRLARALPAPDGRAALLMLVPRSAPESGETMSFVSELRTDAWTDARAADLDVRVGGFNAAIIDFDDELFGSMKRVVPLVLGVTFVVLLVAFRSIVVPFKAIAMNLISVLAAYGFLVYVFQDGIGASLIGLVPPGGLNSFIVLMLFTILFGLSMDYEVFLLSRIKEEYRRSGDNAASVVRGLSGTGGLITSAALIMVVLFGSFAFTRLVATREFGLGLAFAVALDATLIRLVLVPILMGLMGRANWWWPSAAAPRVRAWQ